MSAANACPILAENIPAALQASKRFVAWRSEPRAGQPKPAKMPYSPDAPKGASSTDPRTWTTFDDAIAYARAAHLDGIMRAFDPADGYVGVDLDNCRDPETGEIAPASADIIARLDSYTEVSPSGTGVKIWVKASLPPHGRHKGDVEMYCGERFFTLTGQHVDGTPREVKYRPDAILAIHREVFGDALDRAAVADNQTSSPPWVHISSLEFGQNIGRRSVGRGSAGRPHQEGGRTVPPRQQSFR